MKDNSNIKQSTQRQSLDNGAVQSANGPATPSLPTNSTSSPSSNNNSYLKSGKKSVPNSHSSRPATPASKASTTTAGGSERPLKCLETLAEKAGITFDEKYEAASTLITLEKSQSPAQQVGPSTSVPLQISSEQFQHLHQQFQLQQAFAGGNAIQVKQEFPNQQQGGMSNELKQQIADHNQAHQVQQQMQLMDASSASPQQHHPPNSSAMGMQNQNTTTMTTMSPLQLQGGQVPAEWGHGRVQVVSQPQMPNQAYLQQLYPQVLMPGNIIHPSLGQQQIQVITAGKPFQGQQITPQMLTTAQGKQMIGNGATNFNGAYTLPTSQSQTLVFSPVNIMQQQQQPQQQQILQNMNGNASNQNTPNKTPTQQDLQKTFQGQKLQKIGTPVNSTQNMSVNNQQQQNQQCVVSQTMPTTQLINQIPQSGAQQMQFAPWLQGASMPQFWATTNSIPSQAMLGTNSIFIRPDGTQGMFIQHNPQASAQTLQTAQSQNQTIATITNNQLQQAQQQQQQQSQQQVSTVAI